MLLVNETEQIMKQWDSINTEVSELTCLSEILAWASNKGRDDDIVKLNISGAVSVLTRNINDKQGRYVDIIKEVQKTINQR